MAKSKSTAPKPPTAVRGIDWRAIFERRPDLTPPGYNEAWAESQALLDEATNKP